MLKCLWSAHHYILKMYWHCLLIFSNRERSPSFAGFPMTHLKLQFFSKCELYFTNTTKLFSTITCIECPNSRYSHILTGMKNLTDLFAIITPTFFGTKLCLCILHLCFSPKRHVRCNIVTKTGYGSCYCICHLGIDFEK